MTRSPLSLTPRFGRALLVVAVAMVVAATPVASSSPDAGRDWRAGVPATEAHALSGSAARQLGRQTWLSAERAAASDALSTAAAYTMTLAPFKSGFSKPVFMTSARDGSGRLFVVEQGGRIKVIQADGTVRPTPLLDISGRVSKGSEQGLLGLAFHPNFRTNGKFYVNFTNLAGDTAINEYRLSPPSSNRVTLAGRRVLTIDQPYANHNGGHLAFGADGFLYIGTGDGGSAGDPGNRAQSVTSLLGKILRINVNSRTSTRGYGIPSTNPYVGRAGRDEIWSRGLRNPWRFSIDSATGALWIGDVGQNRYEEVDRSFKGAYRVGGRGLNYGWRVLEGRACYRPGTGCSTAGKTMPLVAYGHVVAGEPNCSVTGGYVYRGGAFPAMQGDYVFGDFCSGRIWTVPAGAAAPAARTLRLDTNLLISSFGLNAANELFVLSLNGGIYQVVATP